MLHHSYLLLLCSLTNTAFSAPASSASTLPDIAATTTLTSVPEASSALVQLYQNKSAASNIVEAYIEYGLTTLDLYDAAKLLRSPLVGADSDMNENKENPSPPIYPKACPDDAPYDLSEEDLRRAIHIPSTFKCGAMGQPIILVPGTGSTGYLSFKGSYIPLLQGSGIADPVWLNIPGYLLEDVQTNAEYVSYAINYISGICKTKVAVAAWSQGNIDAQWVYKYWPSTRGRVTDHIAFSPDYHGSVISTSGSSTAEAPANLQQAYNSEFIKTLRSNGGDAAYVPTTTVYSGLYDEVVEPQQGKNASAYLLSSKEAEASNNEVQHVCPGQPAGSFFTHEGIMYNALGFALLKDALSRDGPGIASQLDLATVCKDYVSPGLNVEDFKLTENTIIIAGLAGKAYPNKTTTEPPIKAYARKAPPSRGTTCQW